MTEPSTVPTVSRKRPGAPIKQQLREQLLAGRTPEEAADAVLDAYGGREHDPLCQFVWPIVLRAARDMSISLGRENRHQVFSGRDTESNRTKRIALPRTVYRLPGGKEVLWGDLTLEEVRSKMAFLRAQVGGILDHLGIMETAERLMLKHNAQKLDEVPDWVERIRAEVQEEQQIRNRFEPFTPAPAPAAAPMAEDAEEPVAAGQ